MRVEASRASSLAWLLENPVSTWEVSCPSSTLEPSHRSDRRSHLEQKHAQLAERIEALDSRLSLTPSEELELHQLKKQKLSAKDALQIGRIATPSTAGCCTPPSLRDFL